MDFDYDLVIPEDDSYGVKLPDGQWDGLIGDLTKGVCFPWNIYLWCFKLMQFVLPCFTKKANYIQKYWNCRKALLVSIVETNFKSFFMKWLEIFYDKFIFWIFK